MGMNLHKFVMFKHCIMAHFSHKSALNWNKKRHANFFIIKTKIKHFVKYLKSYRTCIGVLLREESDFLTSVLTWSWTVCNNSTGEDIRIPLQLLLASSISKRSNSKRRFWSLVSTQRCLHRLFNLVNQHPRESTTVEPAVSDHHHLRSLFFRTFPKT